MKRFDSECDALFKKEFAGVFTNTGKSNQFSGKKMKK